MRPILVSTLLIATAASCSDNPGAPTRTPCTAETGAVSVTVTKSGGSVTFDWNPTCAVAMVLVEEDASDRWVLMAPGLDDTSSTAANIIVPPVTYGQAPQGAEEYEPAMTLVAGHTYDLVLWKVVPPGATVQCQQRFSNVCLLAVKSFTR